MTETAPPVSLWDWRQQVAGLFAAIRAEPDARTGWRLWREKRAALFAGHEQSPLDDRSALPVYFDYDPDLRFLVEFAPPADLHGFALPAGDDGMVAVTPMAQTRGLAEKLGGELTIFWIGGYGGGAFLPFLDASSGRETYGGGRYLIDSIKSADLGRDAAGRTILDFNFAYNPSCYYSPRWTCPLAPRSNRLPAAVRGGEKAVKP